jgi:hypothetical protein
VTPFTPRVLLLAPFLTRLGDARRTGRSATGGLAVSVAVGLLVASCGDDGGGAEATSADPPVEVSQEGEATGSAAVEQSAVEEEREEVVEAFQAAMDARIESAGPAEPDPDLPALTETHTDPRLSEWEARLEGMALQGLAIRYPDDSELEVVEVMDVTFSWWVDDDGSASSGDAGAEVGDKATLQVCIVDDGETYEVESGDVRSSGLYTIHERAVMRKVDGTWKLADHTATEREGRTGCAA